MLSKSGLNNLYSGFHWNGLHYKAKLTINEFISSPDLFGGLFIIREVVLPKSDKKKDPWEVFDADEEEEVLELHYFTNKIQE